MARDKNNNRRRSMHRMLQKLQTMGKTKTNTRKHKTKRTKSEDKKMVKTDEVLETAKEIMIKTRTLVLTLELVRKQYEIPWETIEQLLEKNIEIAKNEIEQKWKKT